ncbi:F-box domain-containing protein [Coccidioides immitis RS]|uniref:F-box domain-containing protein n=3 Tax=Coccidioides immitis TaxID=5501 RepID=J3KCF6_COCIM|nr:F-box domain-containing protein [Coccidioides immitis RS]EAS32921.3 F-box domain-containing protein [Coccidioides immitis RS]KMP08197.1 F-box/LRR-repeat protein 2 [Coccidioides immitis RMSCC 2394]KMU79525.1 F-box/LRR repeat- containing protein 2 [Coccidioides immitis RMSCC 3703]TPX19890.1 hypothetical protein DIZ76_017683 [Coccidioides immitis]
MASIPHDEILTTSAALPAAESGAARPDSPPKLKGRRRLLNRLQRMTSSPSLEQTGRSRSSSTGVRRLGKGSMSCISLSSTLSHGQCWESSSSSQFYGKFSGKPHGDDTGPIRVVETELISANGSQQTTIPLPAEMRPCSRGSLLRSAVAVLEDGENTPDTKGEKLLKMQNKNYWDYLPVEIQLRILSWLMPKELGKVACVSRSWRQLCFDGQLWAKFDTSTYYSDIPRDALVRLIFSAGPFIKHLNLRGCIQMAEAWFQCGEQIADACRNLVSVNLEGTHIDKPTITYFLVRNPKLVRISMTGLATVTNSEMNVISKSCPLLEYLDISWCRNLINANGLRRVVRACHRLKELRIDEFRAVDDEEFMLELFQTNTLETLVMSHCSSLTDSALKALLHGKNPEIDILTGRPIAPPRKLKHLNLSHCQGVSDFGIGHLAGFVPELESLQLSFCPALGNDSIINLIGTTPNLTRLDLEELEELTNNVLLALSKAPCAARLEHLNISYCEKLGDTGMMQIVKNCPNLKSLDLDNTRVSDLTLIELCSQMRKRGFGMQPPRCGLRVAVFDCGNVTWAGIREILSNNTFVPRYAEAAVLASRAEEEEESGSGSSSPSSSTTSVTILPSPPPETTQCKADLYPNEIIQLKCFYGWQTTVDIHTKRVLNGNLGAAMRLERRWTDCMMTNEEAEAGGIGARRRRRRARNAEMMYNLDDDDDADYGYGPGGLVSLGNRRRRARSGGCVVM